MPWWSKGEADSIGKRLCKQVHNALCLSLFPQAFCLSLPPAIQLSAWGVPIAQQAAATQLRKCFLVSVVIHDSMDQYLKPYVWLLATQHPSRDFRELSGWKRFKGHPVQRFPSKPQGACMMCQCKLTLHNPNGSVLQAQVKSKQNSPDAGRVFCSHSQLYLQGMIWNTLSKVSRSACSQCLNRRQPTNLMHSTLNAMEDRWEWNKFREAATSLKKAVDLEISLSQIWN